MKEALHGTANGAPLTPAYNTQQAQMPYQGEASPKDSAVLSVRPWLPVSLYY